MDRNVTGYTNYKSFNVSQNVDLYLLETGNFMFVISIENKDIFKQEIKIPVKKEEILKFIDIINKVLD